MKKKLIATLFAGAVLSAGLIGLTACNNGGGHDINKGEEVDESGWRAAYTQTLEAKNFTMDTYSEITLKGRGSGNQVKEEFGVDSLNMSSKTTKEEKGSYDFENSTYYKKENTSVKTSGIPDSLKDRFADKEYVTEQYAAPSDGGVYSASYYGEEAEPKWQVIPGIEFSPMTNILNYTFATEKDGTQASVSTLYSEFTCKGGVYSATLYRGETDYIVSVSIKGGYVVGVSIEKTETFENEDFTESRTEKTIYNFSNYGSTTVKPSDAAKKAIRDYLAAQN